MTTKQLNKLNPQQYVMTDGLFYIGSLDSKFRHTLTQNKTEAVIWNYSDTVSPHKLDMAKAETGLSKLEFVQI